MVKIILHIFLATVINVASDCHQVSVAEPEPEPEPEHTDRVTLTLSAKNEDHQEKNTFYLFH